MVDFQSRDTRRGTDERTDDPPDEEETEELEEHAEHDHHHHHHDVEQVGAAVVTVSSTRSLDDDPAGDAIAAAFEDDGHEVVTRELVRDSYDGVQSTLDHLVSREDVDVVVSTGGTGVTPDDVTVEAAGALFDKELPGFGELFRRLSYDEVGTRVVGTRAAAGVADGTPVFCLPGSENAARLGSEEVVVPEVGHLAGLAHPHRDDEAE
ncbi:MogA/MoaB family molybdenum cofactor biosynthesis protein [Halobacterium wangiae]|uniref:MogA/MoaB family molybdenum cofactor biosynthesis protein n=1 Tax=Halobacterium wangiae TaxID=2902623 RepID=UPI001E361C04|nr:molybdenum cofactor biosynthesis protein B [Halobacterium wangiae]